MQDKIRELANEMLRYLKSDIHVPCIDCGKERIINGAVTPGTINHLQRELEAVLTPVERGAQAQVENILALCNEHLSGRTYTNAEDAVRNLLQAYVTMKGNEEEQEQAGAQGELSALVADWYTDAENAKFSIGEREVFATCARNLKDLLRATPPVAHVKAGEFIMYWNSLPNWLRVHLGTPGYGHLNAAYTAGQASQPERQPDLVIQRLPDWNWAAFLNETDASCIAIGTTRDEALNNGMRELLKLAAQPEGLRKLSEMWKRKAIFLDHGVRKRTLFDCADELDAALSTASARPAPPVEMHVCEIPHLILHPNQPYIFRAAIDCKSCAEYLFPPATLQPAQPAPPQGKHICCWERENPHRCILCCQCGKKCDLVPSQPADKA